MSLRIQHLAFFPDLVTAEMSVDQKEPFLRYEAESSGNWPLQRRPTNTLAFEAEESAPMRTHVRITL